MKNAEKISLRHIVLKKINAYSHKAAELGQRVRRQVFGFRRRSTLPSDRWSLPVKLLHDHHLVQRRRAFHRSGGSRSGIAQHARNKIRHKLQQS